MVSRASSCALRAIGRSMGLPDEAQASEMTKIADVSGSVGGTIYYMTGATSEEHGLSHDPDQQELVHQAVVFNITMFANLLQVLKDTPEGDGNLLTSGQHPSDHPRQEAQPVHARRIDAPASDRSSVQPRALPGSR